MKVNPADAERCPRAALALLRWHPNRLELALTGETLPNSAQHMPRTKRHDDATVAWLSQ